jgi:hypothetical protein
MCSVGVITIRAQALAVMTITSHPSLLSHPSYYHHNYCHCYPPLQTLSSMFKFIPFPEEAMLIVALDAPKDAS